MVCPQCGTEYRPGFTTCVDCGVPLISDGEYQETEEMREAERKRYNDMKIVEVHAVQGQPEADLIRSLLEANGIESYTRGLAVQSVHPFTMDGLGEIKILVREEDEETAIRIIEEFDES